MKTLQITFLTLLAICFTSCSGNNKAENLANEMLTMLEEVPTIVGEVTDAASAKAACEKLDKLATELIELDNKIKTVKVTEAKKTEIDSKMEKGVIKVFTEVEKKAAAIKDPEAAQIISAGLISFGTRLENS